MTIYLSDRTGASIDLVLDDADAGNIGKSTMGIFSGDVDTLLASGFFRVDATATNAPTAQDGTLTVIGRTGSSGSQIFISTSSSTIYFRKRSASTFTAWQEIYAKGTSKTNAQIDTVIDDADASNVGKTGNLASVEDMNGILGTKVLEASVTASNTPNSAYQTFLQVNSRDTLGFQLSCSTGAAAENRGLHFRVANGTYDTWKELYHTGSSNVHTGVFSSSGASRGSVMTPGFCYSSTDLATSFSHYAFYNPNGTVGTIQTSGTATSYNTSSDPRLEDFTAGPSDTDIDSKFNDLFGAFRTFNWKSDPTGDLVWGFDAHATIDAGLDVGSEGEGPRELALGDVYNTTPAVFEDQEQQVVYKTGDKKGELKFYADGEPVMETISVEVTAAIDHKVSPAGVDQSKAVPILLAKIEQLERRLVAAGL